MSWQDWERDEARSAGYVVAWVVLIAAVTIGIIIGIGLTIAVLG